MTTHLQLNSVELRRGTRQVLQSFSLEVKRGELVGLLGPNGSGKTSLLRILMGLLSPNAGDIALDGKTLSNDSQALRLQLGAVFQEPSLDPKLSIAQNLQLAAALYALPALEGKRRAEELLRFFDLHERRRDAVQKLSGGLKRRVELARALIHGPELLLMDEPTTGLDPVACLRIWQRLEALRQERDLTILLATHSSDEAMRCDRLVVLDEGHTVACDTPDNLLSQVGKDVLVLEADEPEKLAAELEEGFRLEARVVEGRVLCPCEQGHRLVPRLLEAFSAERFAAITVRRPTLHDAFFKLTGRNLDLSQDGHDAHAEGRLAS